MIAMATHGRSGLGRWLFGGVASEVLHSSPVPLLLIRPAAEHVDLSAIPCYRTLLVPLDGSSFAEQALDRAREIAAAVHGGLVLISVLPTPFDLNLVKRGASAEWSAVPWGAAEEHLVKYLDGVTEELASAGLPTQARVTHGDAAGEILKAAESALADMIVMATHGRSGLGHLLVGSVAARICQASPVRVLLVRVN